MKFFYKAVILTSLSLFLTIYGCASISQRAEPLTTTSLEVATLLKFDDIPIPSGFSFIPDKSFVFQNETFRVGLLRYTGQATGEQLIYFYKEQMPLYQWELANIVEYGQRTLSFDRRDEVCTVVIDSKGLKSNISISLAPKAASAKVQK